jgi:hypothetical protein
MCDAKTVAVEQFAFSVGNAIKIKRIGSSAKGIGLIG